MKKIILNITLLLALIAKAQDNTSLSYYFKNFPNSPSTATFLRYGDIQNSEFTGTNSPKIPLYTVVEGGIELPLKLDYISGNGIKVSDEATNVGLGWNIGLPTIVQSVQGYQDFDGSKPNLKIDLHYQPNTPWPAMNYPDKYMESAAITEPSGYIHTPQRGKYTYQYASHYNLPVNGYFNQFNNAVQYDTSPDIFTMNLFGNKIEFVINNFKEINDPSVSPQFTCLNNHGYKISYNDNNYFKITSPEGITYEFGKVEEVRISDIISRNYVLTKIIDVNNNSISLTYNNISDISNFIPFSKNLNYKFGETTTSLTCGGIPVNYGGTSVYASSHNGIYNNPGNNYFPYYATGANGSFTVPYSDIGASTQNYLILSSIIGNFGSVSFDYTTREDSDLGKLSSITLRNKSNITTKTIDFNYEYFNSNQPSVSEKMKKRLKLKSIIINQSEQYGFEYFEDNPLPSKNSYAVDYWGYYNGGLTNVSYFLNPNDFNLSAYNVPLSNIYNNNKKKADINFCTSGMLKKIVYPTRGFAIFEYELNTSDNLFVNEWGPSINNGKGLRLKSQANFDFNNVFVGKTEFTYENGYSTNPLSLIRSYQGSYIDWLLHGFSIISMNSTNNYSASPLSSGDYIGYGKVTRTEKDQNGQSKGRIISTYSITPDISYRFYDDQLPIMIPSTKGEGLDNGLLLTQETRDNSNALLKAINNIYTYTYSPILYGTSFSTISQSLFVCGCITNGGSCPSGQPDHSKAIDQAVVAHFPIFSKESLLTSSVKKEYINNKEFVTQNYYGYNSNNNLSSQVAIFPDGSSESSTLSYAQEANQQKLLNANMISVPLFKTTSRGGQDYSSALTKYDDPVHLNPTSVISGSQYSDMGSENKTEVTYDKYDSRGNLLQYTTKEGIPTTIIWGYNQTQPIAKIIGIKLSDISQTLINSIVTASNTDASAAPGNDESAFLALLDTFRKDPSMAGYQVTTYTYDPLIGVRSITPPSGIREVYIYDSANRLKEIRENSQTGNILKEFKYNYKN